MTNEEANQAAAARAKPVLENLLRLMGFEAQVQVFTQADGSILLEIETAEAGRLIGRGAQVLDALQFILNRMTARKNEVPTFCHVDVERYRERRKDRLLQEALDAAERVIESGQPVRLPPMTASERRVVHQALREHTRVETYSEPVGDAGLKRVVICPAGAAPARENSATEPPLPVADPPAP